MKGRTILLCLALVGLAGCGGSTRSIELKHGSFDIGQETHFDRTIYYSFSRDGRLGLRANLDQMFASKGDVTVDVVDRDSNEVLKSYQASDKSFYPIMFSDDGKRVLLIGGRDGGLDTRIDSLESGAGPGTVEAHGSMTDPGPNFNQDCSLIASNNGVVVTADGKVVQVGEVAGPAYFDMYGSVWYRQKSGRWCSVDKAGRAQGGQDRPAYLVDHAMRQRGSMHLVVKEETKKFENAEAHISTVWLHHDQALGGKKGNVPRNLAALVYVGADVFETMFVPGRDEVAIGDEGGTVFVPFSESKAP